MLKREKRGGISGRLLPERYFCREPFIRELHFSARMVEAGLSPRLAARWFFSRGVLDEVYTLMEPLAGAVSLLELLLARKQNGWHFRATGELAGRLHALGVFHGDLNAGNVLFGSGGKAWAIDWRHSFIFSPMPDAMRLSNLLRLERSITKTAASVGRTMPGDCWPAFADGYEKGSGHRQDAVRNQWLSGAGRRFSIRRAFWRLAASSESRGPRLSSR